jgi:hypothetical protein
MDFDACEIAVGNSMVAAGRLGTDFHPHMCKSSCTNGSDHSRLRARQMLVGSEITAKNRLVSAGSRQVRACYPQGAQTATAARCCGAVM